MVALFAHQVKARDRAVRLGYFGLFFEMGCLSHDAKIKVSRGGALREYSIEKLYRLYNHTELENRELGFDPTLTTYVRSWKGDHVGLHEIQGIVRSGEQALYRLQLDRTDIKLTAEHEVLTKRGWVAAQDLRVGADEVALDLTSKHQKKTAPRPVKVKIRYIENQVGQYHPYARCKDYPYKSRCHPNGRKIWVIEKHRAIAEATLNGMTLEEFKEFTKDPDCVKGGVFVDPQSYHVHHKDHNHKNNSAENLEVCLAKDHLRKHCLGYSNFGHGSLNWRTVVSFEPVGRGVTYDIICKDPYRNFVANNIVVHNSGKSGAAIDTMRQWCLREKRYLRTLVIGPNIVVENWLREFHKFSKAGDKVTTLTGTGRQRLRTMQVTTNPIIIASYETISMGPVLAELKKWRPEIIIVDESSRIKSGTAKRTKATLQLAQMARYRLILTGTPILNTALDLYTQIKVLGQAGKLGATYTDFRARFFEDKNAGIPKAKYFPDWRIRKGAMDEIRKILAPFCMAVKKEDCLDLPPLVQQNVYVPLSAEQKRLYEEMKRDFVTYVGSSACVATLAITKALRLQQIVSGFVNLQELGEEAKNVTLKDNPRALALQELLAGITHEAKCIVWCVFHENYATVREICDTLKLRYVELHGQTPAKDRQRAVDTFNEDPSVRVFISHPGSGGIGINLVSASYCIFYSRSFSLEESLQAESRNHRKGSEIHNKVTRIDLIAKGTIDEVITRRLASKVEIGNKLLQDIAKEL